MVDYNLHQHSIFSDGKDKPESYVKRAIELGFSAIGFSEHSPLPFDNPFSLKEVEVDNYINEIDQLKTKYKDQVEIYRALEMDYVPEMSEDFDYWRIRCRADYLIGSVHLVKPDGFDQLWFTDGPDYKIYDKGIEKFFNGDVKKAVRKFYMQTNEMIDSQKFEIIGHFDKIKMHNRNRYFSDADKWYRDLVDETVKLIKENNIIVEINTRGLYKKRSDSYFPDGYALQKVKELNIPIVISSDAHQSSEINQLFDQAAKMLVSMGFKEVMDFSQGAWKVKPFSNIELKKAV